MKALFFLFATCLLIFGLFKVITSSHNVSPIDDYINASIKASVDNAKSISDNQHWIDSVNNSHNK